MNNLPHLKYRAFTLIELLVSIGIVVVLAALIAPAITAGMDRAQSARCVSNLRQIGGGLVNYVVERKGELPLPHDDNRVFYGWNSAPAGLAMIVEAGLLPAPPSRYTENIIDRGIYACPSLIPYKNYIGGGDQITYRVDSRNGRYRENIGGEGVNYVSAVKAWDVSRSSRAQVACSSIAAHHGHPNVLYLDGHVAPSDTEMAKRAYEHTEGAFVEFDLSK